MKILYIGVYRDGTGWAQSALDYILAIDAAGLDVVARPVRLNAGKNPIPNRILELEKKSSKDADIVIQHVLPHQMDYCGNFKKNIAMYFTETSNFSSTNWANKINTLDEAWVPNSEAIKVSQESGVKVPVEAIPIPTDLSRFQKKYEKMDFAKELKGSFIFYTIGEATRRKNLGALLKAFHSEFRSTEPVELVIKSSQHGLTPEELKFNLTKYCTEVKQGLKLNKEYKKEILITNRLSDDSIMRLHHSCDCFVSASFGEAWCIPAFDAMGCGKTPIVTNCGGFKEYMSNEAGWLVNSIQEPVFGMNKESFSDLYTANENWNAVSIADLKRCMREAYELRNESKAEFGINRVYDFGYENVGQHIKKVLQNEQKRQRGSPT